MAYAEFKGVSHLYISSLLPNMKLINVLAEFGPSAVRFSSQKSKGQRWHYSGALQCLLDSVALKAANECRAETGHWIVRDQHPYLQTTAAAYLKSTFFTHNSNGREASSWGWLNLCPLTLSAQSFTDTPNWYLISWLIGSSWSISFEVWFVTSRLYSTSCYKIVFGQ